MKIIARKSYFFVYLSAFIACCCFISFVAQGASNIVAINSPIELEKIIMQKADQSALFVFDIDDTLIASSKPILRANALNKLINSTTQKYACSIKEVIGLIELKLHTAHDHLGSGSPVSTDLIRSIQNLLKQKMRIIALTNVDSGPIIINIPTLKISKKLNVTYEDRRFKDLKTIGLDFSNSFVEKILYLYDDLNSKSLS